MATKKVIVKMNDDLISKIDEFAIRTNRDRSKVIRYACERIVGELK